MWATAVTALGMRRATEEFTITTMHAMPCHSSLADTISGNQRQEEYERRAVFLAPSLSLRPFSTKYDVNGQQSNARRPLDHPSRPSIFGR